MGTYDAMYLSQSLPSSSSMRFGSVPGYGYGGMPGKFFSASIMPEVLLSDAQVLSSSNTILRPNRQTIRGTNVDHVIAISPETGDWIDITSILEGGGTYTPSQYSGDYILIGHNQKFDYVRLATLSPPESASFNLPTAGFLDSSTNAYDTGGWMSDWMRPVHRYIDNELSGAIMGHAYGGPDEFLFIDKDANPYGFYYWGAAVSHSSWGLDWPLFWLETAGLNPTNYLNKYWLGLEPMGSVSDFTICGVEVFTNLSQLSSSGLIITEPSRSL